MLNIRYTQLCMHIINSPLPLSPPPLQTLLITTQHPSPPPSSYSIDVVSRPETILDRPSGQMKLVYVAFISGAVYMYIYDWEGGEWIQNGAMCYMGFGVRNQIGWQAGRQAALGIVWRPTDRDPYLSQPMLVVVRNLNMNLLPRVQESFVSVLLTHLNLLASCDSIMVSSSWIISSKGVAMYESSSR